MTNKVHPYVTILETAKGHVARWTEPSTGKQKQQNLKRTGAATQRQRIAFAKKLSKRLVAEKAAQAAGLVLAAAGPQAAVAQTPEAPATEAAHQPQKAKPQPSIAELAKAYLGRYENQNTRASVQQSIRKLTDLVGPTLPDFPKAELAKLHDDLSLSGSPNTQHLHRKQVAGFLRWCADRGHCDAPEAGLKLLGDRQKTVSTPTTSFMQLDEVQGLRRWLRNMSQSYNRDALVKMLDVQLLTGLRISELCAIQPEHVKSDHLQVPVTKTGVPREVEFSVSGPMLPELLDGLQRDSFNLRFPYMRNLQRAGHSSHEVRRTVATALWNSGLLPPIQAARMLGHSISVAEKKYVGKMRKADLLPGQTVQEVMGLQGPCD